MALRQGAARPPRDAGLQAERTALAWNRTGMALLANALLALRLGLVGGQALVMGLGVALLGGALAVTLPARRPNRQERPPVDFDRRPLRRPPPRDS